MSKTDIPVRTIADVVENDLALVSKSQAAIYLDCAPTTIINRVHSGALEGFMIPQTNEGRKALHITIESILALKKEGELFLRKVEKIVLKCCRKRQLITYGDLMELVDRDPNLSNDRKEISQVLAKISEKSFNEYGVMLSALVVNKKNQIPSEGFYNLAEELSVSLGDTEDWFEKYQAKIFDAMQQT